MQIMGVVLNHHREDILIIAKEILLAFKDKIQVLACEDYASDLGLKKCSIKEFCQKSQMILVIGGDGTLLRAARLTYGYELPILGINKGYLGFLSELEVDELKIFVKQILAGEFSIERRSMLEAKTYSGSECTTSNVAFNDMVITKGAFARIISIEVRQNNVMVDKFLGDGVIISTATGSTGYSLSAGGPIVYPNLDVMIMTPICPHSLTSRPVIFANDKSIEITIGTDMDDCMLTVDGQQGVALKNKDKIVISKGKYDSCLVKLKNIDFFEVLHNKFTFKEADKFN